MMSDSIMVSYNCSLQSQSLLSMRYNGGSVTGETCDGLFGLALRISATTTAADGGRRAIQKVTNAR